MRGEDEGWWWGVVVGVWGEGQRGGRVGDGCGWGGRKGGRAMREGEGKGGKEGSCVVWINGFVALDSVLRELEWLVYWWWWWGISF